MMPAVNRCRDVETQSCMIVTIHVLVNNIYKGTLLCLLIQPPWVIESCDNTHARKSVDIKDKFSMDWLQEAALLCSPSVTSSNRHTGIKSCCKRMSSVPGWLQSGLLRSDGRYLRETKQWPGASMLLDLSLAFFCSRVCCYFGC